MGVDGTDPLVYGVCTIMGLANACINPVLYGYLNENFRIEYKSLFNRIPWHTSIASAILSNDHQLEANGHIEPGLRSPSNRSLMLNNTGEEIIPLVPLNNQPPTPPGGENPQLSLLHYLNMAKSESGASKANGINGVLKVKVNNVILRPLITNQNGDCLESKNGVNLPRRKPRFYNKNVKVTFV
jgi:hypothetical protein